MCLSNEQFSFLHCEVRFSWFFAVANGGCGGYGVVEAILENSLVLSTPQWSNFFKPLTNEEWYEMNVLFYFIFGCQSSNSGSNNSRHEPNVRLGVCHWMSRTIVLLAPRQSKRLPTQLCFRKWENVHCHYFVWHINNAYCIQLRTLCPVHCELFACMGYSLYVMYAQLSHYCNNFTINSMSTSIWLSECCHCFTFTLDFVLTLISNLRPRFIGINQSLAAAMRNGYIWLRFKIT